MAPGRMPRRQGARWSAALFQFITRDKPAAHKTGPLGICVLRGTELFAARRRWWRGWSGRRAGGCAGPRASSGGGAGSLALVALHAAAGCHRSVTTHVAGTAGPLIDRLADGIFQRSEERRVGKEWR